MVRTMGASRERGRTAGDAAVDGLLAGAAAGIAMAGYLVITGWLAGEGPVHLLARFDPSAGGASGSAAAISGALIHLAVSAVYGLAFGLLYWLVGRGRLAGRLAGALLGLGYGLLLFLIAQRVVAIPTGAALAAIPALHFAAAHLIYGLVLGWIVVKR